MNTNNSNIIFDSSMNSYLKSIFKFTQNGTPLDYSNIKNFILSPTESRHLCATIEQYYSKIQLELLTQNIVSILSKCTNSQNLECLKQLSYTRNGKVLDYTSNYDFENLDPTELAHICWSIEEFYTDKFAKIMGLIYTYNNIFKQETIPTIAGHKRKHWEIDEYYDETD